MSVRLGVGGRPGDLESARCFGTNFHGAGLTSQTESASVANETRSYAFSLVTFGAASVSGSFAVIRF
jgi:hypothetical protein